MKLILSSCDFLNENSRKVILSNIPKDLKDCKVLFIPNEKATEKEIYSDKYYKRLNKNGFTNENIYIFDEHKVNEFKNLNIDILYVGGGNTFGTLKKIKDSGFDKAIIDYINKGVIYIGGSCGAHLLTKNIEHLLSLDNNIYELENYDALGVVDFILIPHYASNEYNPREREELYNRLLKENKYKVFTLTNDESLIITNKTTKK